MNALVEQTAFGVTTNSRTVADYFGKQHQHVLRDIDVILKTCPELEGDKFHAMQIDVPMPKGGGMRQVRAFEMDRDGFSLLVMGFTGEEALNWKVSYMRAFNRMEAELLRKAKGEPQEVLPPAMVLPPLGELTRKVAVAEAYRRMWGPDAGRWMIAMLGLPVPECGMISVEPQGIELLADNVLAWIDECCERDGESKVLSSKLYASYQTWCAENRRVPETMVGFGRSLSRIGVSATKNRTGHKLRHGLKLLE